MNQKFIEYLEGLPNRGKKLGRFLQVMKEIRDENKISPYSYKIMGYPTIVPIVLREPIDESLYEAIVHIVNGGAIRDLLKKDIITEKDKQRFFALKLFCNSKLG